MKKYSWGEIIGGTIAELIIIFTAAATGAIIGSGRGLRGDEWILAFIFVLFAIIIRSVVKR